MRYICSSWKERRKMKKMHSEWKWFDKHRKLIVDGHCGEFVLVYKHRIWGYFKDMIECRDDGYRKGFKDFLVQECLWEERYIRIGSL